LLLIVINESPSLTARLYWYEFVSGAIEDPSEPRNLSDTFLAALVFNVKARYSGPRIARVPMFIPVGSDVKPIATLSFG
jgi:hypothetical protein